MKAVLDASALLAAIDAERPECAVALHHLRGRARLVAPTLAGSELGNVIHAKRYGLGRDAKQRTLLHGFALEGVDLVPPTQDHWLLASHLASKHSLSFLDAEYLATALATQSDLLVTEDRAMRKAGVAELGAERSLDWDAIRRATST